MTTSSPPPKQGQETPPEVVTLGCRLNTYESQVMKDHMRKAGLQDTIVVNTCAVTGEAERQARQRIRKLHRQFPHAKIIATGCAAQINPDAYAKIEGVHKVLGNLEKMELSSFENLSLETPKVQVQDIMAAKETAGHLISGFDGRARAFIEIQNGCNHRCTFCTIPFGRGNNRSVPMPEIIQQIRHLRDEGCEEVVFTGVDITDYGKDLPGQPTLGQLVRRVLVAIPDLQRLRLSSIDPVEVDETLYQVIATEQRLMPHFHISLQSGDDMVLRRMKRRHVREDILHFCRTVKTHRPEAIFGADIIAGFPTETEEQFQNSLSIIEEAPVTFVHAFPYSPRPGTPAAKMPQVDGPIRKARAKALIAAGEEQLKKSCQSRVGQVVQVLLEKSNQGHCEHFLPVMLEEEGPQGEIVSVKLTGLTPEGTGLVGYIIKEGG